MARRESVDVVLKPEMAKFFHDYTREFPMLADLYFGDPASVDKYVEMTSDPYLRMIKRPRLQQVLHDYNVSLGAPAQVMENIDKLRYDGAYAVLAWQQPYLLGGPLETLLKCLTAIKLCERLNQTGAAKFVPVLWIHADDHELWEVNRLKLPAGSRIVEEKLDIDESERPSEAVETGDAYDALLARLGKLLPDTPHKAWLAEVMAATKGQNLGDHCARFLMRIFGEHGLVIACPRIFRQEISALLNKAVEDPDRINRLLAQQKAAFEEKGLRSHTDWQGDPLWLYRITDGHPLRLKWMGGKFLLEATGGEMTPAQVAKENKSWPQIYTNGVYLSPLEQDSCLPAVAHVAGPGGVEFFGVLKALFDDYRVAFPIVCPQVSATLIDRTSAKGLEKLRKTVVDLIDDARKAAAAAEMPPDHGAALALLRDEILKTVEGYDSRTGEVAADTSRVATEASEAIARELAKLNGLGDASRARDAVLAALSRWSDRALEVSGTVAAALGEVRKRVEADLPARYEPPSLAQARDEVARAAANLAKSARPPESMPGRKLAGELSKKLDEMARGAIEAANAKAAVEVSDTDVAKLVTAPEGGLQEDTIAMLHFVNQRGPGLVAEVAAAIDPFDFRHQLVYLE